MGVWRTMPNGVRVFIKDGQDLSDAFRSDREIESNDKKFKKRIVNFLKGKYKSDNHIIFSEYTPVNLISVGLSNLPMTIVASKLDHVINATGKQNRDYHDLGSEIFEKIPNALKNPKCILKSKEGVIVVTKLKDKKGNPIIVPIKSNGVARIKNGRVAANVITSAYGRKNYSTWIDKQTKL